MAVVHPLSWYIVPGPKRLMDVLGTAIPESPSIAFLRRRDGRQAVRILSRYLGGQNPIRTRGGYLVRLHSPDYSIASFLARSGLRVTDLEARVIHALTDSRKDRQVLSPGKVVTAGNLPQTLQQADFVVAVESHFRGREGHPDLAFVKAYCDVRCATGVRWHIVIVNEALYFMTQYSTPNKVGGRVSFGRILAVGRQGNKKSPPPDTTEGRGQSVKKPAETSSKSV